MYRWGVFALLCALLVASTKAYTCDRFDIRNSGQTLFAITSNDGTVWIPGDLELGAISTNQILMGDYVFGVHNALGEAQIGLRKRRMDPDTGKYHVPRAIRGFAHNGTTVIYDHEFRDATEFTLYELRDFMREVLADELALEGHNDPFNLAARYTSAGEWCKDENPLADCVATRDDMFDIVSSEESAVVLADWTSVWERDPQAGDEGYQGFVTSLDFVETPEGEEVFRSSPSGALLGSAGFRLDDSEVEDVYWLQADAQSDFEVTPGVVLEIWGWRGGQVMDFELTDGVLTNGAVFVGPFPDSDASDVVLFAGEGFDLELRNPGPALRFSPGRNVRIYVSNALETPVTVNWGNIVTPHDQSGIPQFAQEWIEMGSTWVYEFQVPEGGSAIYSDMAGKLQGPAIVNGDMDWDREYVLFTQGMDMLNGNVYPGTVERLSGWFKDTIRIKDSRVDEATGDVIVTILDEPRQPHEGSNEDAHWPVVKYDCPAHGGPVMGRWGTGCTVDGVHENRGHNIYSKTLNPGQYIEIEGHHDTSLNGPHYVVKETLDSFRIKNVDGNLAAAGGEGGFVHIWRLHKSHPEYPEWQNTGASGSYLRFNYGETVSVRLFNGDNDPHNIHIHGHKFYVSAENGQSVGASRFESAYSIAPGTTADLSVMATNPNRVGAWLVANDLQYQSEVAAHTPWPEAELTSGGPTTWVDYTGFAQESLVLDADGLAVPISWVPPMCSVEKDTITVVRDILGWTFEDGSDIWVHLDGMGEFANNPASGTSFGTVTGYEWTVLSRPGQDDPTFFTPDEASTFVTDLEDGTYVFGFTVYGRNAYESGDNVVECRTEVTVHVCENGCGDHNDLDNIPHSWVSPALQNLRLGVEDVITQTPSGLKRQVVNGEDGEDLPPCVEGEDGNIICYDVVGDSSNQEPTGLGHATFTVHPAGRLARPDRIFVAEFYAKNVIPPPGQDPNPFSPLNTGRNFTFHRWSNLGPNTDFWFDIDPQTTSDRSSWNFAIKQAVFDNRIQTYGYVLAADIGSSAAPWPAGQMPPAHHRVVYPMWQGSSSFGLHHHDVYFLVLESSDEEFCEKFGCVYTPTLSEIPLSSEYLNPATLERGDGESHVNERIRQRVTTGTFAHWRTTRFVFTQDPNVLPERDMFNPSRYSPLKHVTWVDDDGNTKHVVANMPFVYWGELDVQNIRVYNSTWKSALEAEGKLLIVDEGGCDPLIRGINYRPESGSYASSTGGFSGSGFTTSGPPGCTGGSSANRRRGGQLLAFPDFRRMYAVFKVHRAAFDSEVIPYFSITDTSDFQEAQYHGVPWTPALNMLGGASSASYVAHYRQLGNGIDGPSAWGTQDSIVSTFPDLSSWTPFWEISTLYWNCGEFELSLVDLTGVTEEDYADWADSESYNMHNIAGRPQDIFLRARNAAQGGSSFNGPNDDFFQLIGGMKTARCPGYIMANTDSEDGMVFDADIQAALDANAVIETANPPASTLSSAMSSLSILNAHVPFVAYPNTEVDPEDWVAPFVEEYPSAASFPNQNAPLIPGAWVLLYKNLSKVVTPIGWRSTVKDAEPFLQGDNGILGDFPPAEPIFGAGSSSVNNCPNCLWSLFANSLSSRYYSVNNDTTFSNLNQHPFRLSVATSSYTPNTLINYVLMECDDSEFAEAFGTTYEPLLGDFPTDFSSTAVFWDEPDADEEGNYAAEDVAAALNSFVFEDVPRAIGSLAVNHLYTPIKTFSFRNRLVTCNMPFVAWGSNVDEHIAVDEGECSPLIRSDWYGNPDTFFAYGPPNCEDEVHPLQRSWGGQVLAWEPGMSVTMKVHRAINRPDNTWRYYSIFDTSNPVMAGYFGIPVSGHLMHLDTDNWWDYGLNELQIFANGISCPRCNPYGFQDPIIGVEYNGLRVVTNLLWNCDDLLKSQDLFAKANHDQNACPEVSPSPDCDPYPLRADLKFTECFNYVYDNTWELDNKVYFNDQIRLIEERKVFQTYSPVGVPPNDEWSKQEVLNAPIVLIVDFNEDVRPPPVTSEDDGSTGSSNDWWSDSSLTLVVATDNTERWLQTTISGDWLDWYGNAMNMIWEWNAMAAEDDYWTEWEQEALDEAVWEVISTIESWDVEWEEVSPASRGSVEDGSVGSVHVYAGDWVSFWSFSDSVPHGLVLSDSGEWNSAYDAIEAFFEDIHTEWQVKETTEERFEALYGHPGIQQWLPTLGGHLFTARVRDNTVGTRLYFSDLVWGTWAMNGALELDHE